MFIYKDADSRYVYEHADAARKREDVRLYLT